MTYFLSVKMESCECYLFSYLLQVDGNFLERALASKQRTGYTAVLFYASWCPFSCSMYPTFGMLSFKFPQVEHLAIEQSSALPRCKALNWPASVLYLFSVLDSFWFWICGTNTGAWLDTYSRQKIDLTKKKKYICSVLCLLLKKKIFLCIFNIFHCVI